MDEIGKERGEGGPRWMPIATAIVAVLAALIGLLNSQRSTQALIQKNEEIAALAKASDTYNYYQAKAIKEELYKGLIVSHRADPKLQAVVDHEETSKKPVLEKARDYDREADAANARSERYLRSHETLEISVTLLEVAIVILSISTLAGTVTLPVIAGLAILAGIGFAIAGILT